MRFKAGSNAMICSGSLQQLDTEIQFQAPQAWLLSLCGDELPVNSELIRMCDFVPL